MGYSIPVLLAPYFFQMWAGVLSLLMRYESNTSVVSQAFVLGVFNEELCCGMRLQPVNSLNKDRPWRNVSAASTTANGKLIVEIDDTKWPLLNLYTPNSNRVICAAAAVRKLPYLGEDNRRGSSTETSKVPNVTGEHPNRQCP